MAVGALTEEVALNLEEAAAVTRKLNTKNVGIALGGVGVGIVIGFFIGYRYNREKIRAEAFKESEAEVEQIRSVYQAKETARTTKPPIEVLIEEKGYTGEEVEEQVVIRERPLPAPVPIIEKPITYRTEDGEKSKNDGWSYPYELSRRSPDKPYIIHQDEFATNETGYSQVTYTVYEGDGVILDEHDTVIDNADNLIGLENLKRWGHGSDDINVLYIRNSELEIEFELCRTPQSYEADVLGLTDNEES